MLCIRASSCIDTIMSEAQSNGSNLTSRRDFIKTSGKIAAASALAGVAIPHVHASDSQTINVALVGCGGRGSGAADQALSVKDGNTKLIAMADVFENRLKSSYGDLKKRHSQKVNVSDDKKFIGIEGYKHAIDC